MNVLVTGGLGFIGKHTLAAFEGRGHLPVPIDKKEPSNFDLADPLSAEMAFTVNDPSVIVHLAATSSTPGSLSNPMVTFRDTVMCGAFVIEQARRRGVPLILVSSVKARDGKTPYGASKRMVELWAQEYAEAFGFPLIIVRPGTVYGRGQEGSPESGWIAWFLKARHEGLSVVINGDGSQTRDLLHVSDLAQLFVAMAENPNPYVGKIWDVGGGVKNAVTVEQMARFIGVEFTYGPPRYGDVDSYIGINDAPDWEPHIKWRHGIRRLM